MSIALRHETAARDVTAPALTVHGLTVHVAGVARPIVDGIGFTLARGEALGLVGPSGAGKTTAALALMGLLPRGITTHPEARVTLGGTTLLDASAATWRAVRGRRIAMVFQEPMLALNPVLPVVEQVAEVALVHGWAPDAARRHALGLLARVGLDPAEVLGARFPHQLSGGQRQRVLLTMAMCLEPEVIIADEPTTALDPATREAMLDQLDALRRSAGTALVLISHDPAVIAARCTRVLRLEAGRPVAATTDTTGPATPAARVLHPVGAPAPAGDAPPLLKVRDLVVRYAADPVLAGVTLTVRRGEALGLTGPSGAGKSTLAHAIARVVPIASGTLHLDGIDLASLRGEALRRMRRRLQLVAQDAGASLTPHLSAEALVAEGLEVHALARGAEARRRARALLDEVGLPARAATARPRELSAGERQRVALARALAPAPELLVCDEPWAALDHARRDAILALLEALRADRGLALLVISHDHDAVRRLASTVLPMYLGRVAAAPRADADR